MSDENTDNLPPEQPVMGSDDAPKFGRLLIVLFLAVLVIIGITFAAEAYYS
jgi:hypothetical protein